MNQKDFSSGLDINLAFYLCDVPNGATHSLHAKNSWSISGRIFKDTELISKNSFFLF